MAGRDVSESVAKGGAGYLVKNRQIAEASLFFRPFLNRLLNPALTIVIFDFSDFVPMMVWLMRTRTIYSAHRHLDD